MWAVFFFSVIFLCQHAWAYIRKMMCGKLCHNLRALQVGLIHKFTIICLIYYIMQYLLRQWIYVCFLLHNIHFYLRDLKVFGKIKWHFFYYSGKLMKPVIILLYVTRIQFWSVIYRFTEIAFQFFYFKIAHLIWC